MMQNDDKKTITFRLASNLRLGDNESVVQPNEPATSTHFRRKQILEDNQKWDKQISKKDAFKPNQL